MSDIRELNTIRQDFDALDKKILELFSLRFKLVEEVIEYKKVNDLPIFQPDREKEMYNKVATLAEEFDVSEEFIRHLLDFTIAESKVFQARMK